MMRNAKHLKKLINSQRSLTLKYYHSYPTITAKNVSIPKEIKECNEHKIIGKEIINLWRKEAIFSIMLDKEQNTLMENSLKNSKKFYNEFSLEEKKKLVLEDSYSGYTASGEEITGAYADTPEVFTIFEDIPRTDMRNKNKWPCHGPVPWPFDDFKKAFLSYNKMILELGDRVLQLISLGLELKLNTLKDITKNGCYNIRIIKYPRGLNGDFHGIGAHTDYGFLSLGNQTCEGILIRPPIEGEKRGKNWIANQAGKFPDDENWQIVKSVPGHITCYPGDMFQLLTNGYIMPTPHKVSLNPNEERFSSAMFHEPNFNATLVPLLGEKNDHYHFGTHITNLYVANCPNRITTKYIRDTGGYDVLKKLADESLKDVLKNNK